MVMPGEDIRDLLDTVHNCLIAAGGSTDIDELEQQLFEAGSKPSEFVAYRITLHRRLLHRFTDLCDVHFMNAGPMPEEWKRLYDDTQEFLGTAMTPDEKACDWCGPGGPCTCDEPR